MSLGPFWVNFGFCRKKTSNDMDSLLDLTACFLWCLDKLSHGLHQTHCNSPPWIFGIAFIAAILSYSSPLICCKRMGHTNLHPVLCSLKSVCKGKRGDKHLGSWQFPPCPCCPAGAGGSLCSLHPSAAPKTSEHPLPQQWLSQPTGTRQDFSDDSEKLRKGLWLYIYYKCLCLHTFKPSAKGIMYLRFAWYFAWLLSIACRSFCKQKCFFPRVLCLRNKRCTESNLPWAWEEKGDSEMLL